MNVLRKILIIDDDESFVSFIKSVLQERNFSVDVALSGIDGLEKVKARPDVVLLDRSLPDMDGLEICRMIRENHRFRGTPVIILSARDNAAERVGGLYIGADDYVTKPFDTEELLARVEVVLRRSELADHLHEEHIQLVEELKNVIAKEQIIPFFQPIFSFTNFRPIGFEVLSRPAEGGALNNPEFMFRLALKSGLYFELEMLGWRKAFRQWFASQREGKIFLNCSPYLIESGKFDGHTLTKAGMQLEHAVLELTERVAIQDHFSLMQKIAELREKNLQFAIDDVGCGFASLNTVVEVKPDYVKIDMSLIHNIDQDELKQDIVKAIVYFSKRSGITTIAEGIETHEELQKVIELNVDAGQGYLLGKPDPVITAACQVHK